MSGSVPGQILLRRMVPKHKSPNLFIFGVELASCLREAHQERWGASPPTFPNWVSRRQEASSTPQIGQFGFLSFGIIRYPVQRHFTGRPRIPKFLA